MNNIAKQLQESFPEADYEWRVQSENYDGTTVIVLCYVTARAIQNRLDEVFGPFGWCPEYRAGPDGGVICRLSCKDPISGEWVAKEDGAENTDIESIKGGISSAIKRAAVVWGIGRHLYNLDATPVKLESRGEHYYKPKKGVNKDKWMYWTPPKLPAWAVKDEPKKASTLAYSSCVSSSVSIQNPPPKKAPSKSTTKKAEFWDYFKARCAELALDIPSKTVLLAVISDMCGSKEAGDIAAYNEWDMPIPDMDADCSGWQVLTQMLSTYNLAKAISNVLLKPGK